MTTNNINLKIQEKQGREYVTTWETTDALEVYDRLAHEMISKKINCCTYIRAIKRRNNYNGTQTITITYDNGTRAVYTVSEH